MNVRVISCLDRALVPCYEQHAWVVLKARLQCCGDARVLLQAGSCSAHGARGCIPALHTQGSFAVFTTTPPSPCGRSPAGNGYVSARASPGLLPVSNGSTLGKIIPAKSPPPPPHSTQLASNSRKPDLRVITSQSGKGLMHHLVSGAARHCRDFGTSAGLVQAPLPPPRCAGGSWEDFPLRFPLHRALCVPPVVHERHRRATRAPSPRAAGKRGVRRWVRAAGCNGASWFSPHSRAGRRRITWLW